MKMRQIIALLLALMLGATFLAGCGDGDKGGGDKGGGEENATLVGEWVHSWGYVYEFKENGTGSYTIGEMVSEFNYEDKGDKIIFVYKNISAFQDVPTDEEGGYVYQDPQERKYSIKGKKLSVEDSFGEMVEYEKK